MIPQRDLQGVCEISNGTLAVIKQPPLYTGEASALNVQVLLKNNGVNYTPPEGVSAEMYLYFPNTENMTLAYEMEITGNLLEGTLPASATGIDGYPLLIIQLIDTATGDLIVAAHYQVRMIKTRGKYIVSTEAPSPSEVVYIGKSPYVDTETGHWMEWDASQAKYVDSGVNAQGPKGDKGDAGSVTSVQGIAPDGQGNVQLTGEDTETGNPITVETDSAQIAKHTVLTFEPIQDLHGYDHPWPAGGGKNLVDYLSCIGIAPRATGNVFPDGPFTSISGDVLTISCAYKTKAGILVGIQWPEIAENTEFTVSYDANCTGTKVVTSYGIYGGGGTNQYFNDTVTANTWVNISHTFTAQGGQVALFTQASEVDTVLSIKNLQLEIGSVATSYVPYSNVCPISGVDTLEINTTSDNLIPAVDDTGDGYVDKAYVRSDGEIISNASYYISRYFKVEPNTKYTLNASVTKAQPSICFYDINKNYIIGFKINNLTTQEVETPTGAMYCRASQWKAEPFFSLISEKSIGKAFPETVYGGTLDLETGRLVIPFVIKKLSECTINYSSDNARFSFLLNNAKKANSERTDYILSDSYYSVTDGRTLDNVPDCSIYRGNNYTICIHDSRYNDASAFSSAMGDSKIVYELVNPIVRYVTPDALHLLKGSNSVSTNAKTISVIVNDGEIETLENSIKTKMDVNTLYGIVNMLINDKTEMSFKNFKGLVNAGYAQKLYPVGSQLIDTWKDENNTEYECPWDIVHYDKAGNAYLKWHYSLDAIQFDAPEALYYVGPNGLAAGTYHIDIGLDYGGWSTSKSIQFTLSTALVEGDQIFIDTGSDRNNDPTNGRTLKTYSKGSTTAKETTTTSNGTGGTSLGSTSTVSPHITNGSVNAPARVAYGYNRYSESAIRQFLNSSETVNAWWTPQNPWDRPPTQHSTMRGLLAGCSSDFLSILRPINVVTALNTAENFDVPYDETYDKIFLPSLQEMYIEPQLANTEGEDWDYYKALAKEAGLSGRFQQYTTYEILKSYKLKNHTVGIDLRLRSASRLYAYSAWYVKSSGLISTNYAYGIGGSYPTCKIMRG